jgi:hypothetical protein
MPTFVNISCFLCGGGCFLYERTAGAEGEALDAKSAEEEEKSDRCYLLLQ